MRGARRADRYIIFSILFVPDILRSAAAFPTGPAKSHENVLWLLCYKIVPRR